MQTRPTVRPGDLRGPQVAELRRLLNFRKGRKLFRGFSPRDTLVTNRAGRQVRLIDLSRWYKIEVPDTTDVLALAARLESLPPVVAATPEYSDASVDVIPNDPKINEQWGYDNPSTDADVDAPEAWTLNKGRSDVVVAVVDGGVDLDHPDLDPGDRSRVIQGYDFGDDDPNPDDSHSSGDWVDHGTPVAGTIGAMTDNNQGVAGLMWDVQIMPLKIVSSSETGRADKSVVAQAFNYARANGADVINYSGRGDFPTLLSRFYRGNPLGEAAYNAYLSRLVVAASSGNDYDDKVYYPASMKTTIGVGATDFNDARHDYSNYGSRLSLVAPSGFETTRRYGTYDQFGGTSQAAPVVSGVAGLILSESRDRGLGLTNDDVMHLMQQTADDLGSSGRDDEFGHGRVNAYEALQVLQPPNKVEHAVHTGGSGTRIYEDDQIIFYDNGLSSGVASGTYFADVYEVTGRVTFENYYPTPPRVWIRERSTKGWSVATPQDEMPYVEISNVTSTSFDFKTFVYYIESDINGRDIGWKPVAPSYVEIAYTAIGERGIPPLDVSIDGPTSLDSEETGTWIADVNGGQGTTSYQWSVKGLNDTQFDEEPGATASSFSESFRNTSQSAQSASVKVVVDKGIQQSSATLDVAVLWSPTCGIDCPILSSEKRSPVANLGATADRSAAILTWTSSTPPTSFTVQHRADSTADWSRLGVVEAADSVHVDSTSASVYQFRTDALDVGTHQFRLEYTEAKGANHSAIVDANVVLNTPYEATTYPNPVRNRAQLDLAVRRPQHVTIRVYDVPGRSVATAHDGRVPAQSTERVPLDVDAMQLTAGTYFVRIVGETFVATRRLTVVR